MNKALIIIDMQIMPFVWKDYGGFALYKEKELIENTQILINKARDADAPIFYIFYTEQDGSPRAKDQPLWQIHPEIIPTKHDRLIIKHYADSFYKTDLEKLLREGEITDVVLCGVQTEYCVDTTCKSAFSHNLRVEFVSDAHSTYDTERLSAEQIINHHNIILEQFAAIKSAQDIIFI